MNTIVPIIGQLASITVQAAAACFMFYLLGDMKYNFYHITLNSLRFLYYRNRTVFLLKSVAISMLLLILSSLQKFNVGNVICAAILSSLMIWLLMIISNKSLRTLRNEELRNYIEPYHWLKDNMVYTWYMIKGWSTVIIVFGLLHQLALDQVYTKPKEFFIGSPISGLSFVLIVIHLVSIVKKQQLRIKLLEAMNQMKS